MEYSFLQNFSSLLEVFTAIYVSMFLDDILVNIWTPHYKQQISQLIKNMNIPAINYFVRKVEDNIDENAKTIRGHMRKKAAFYIVFCMGLLLLAGLEVHSNILPKYGYFIITGLSLFAFLSFLFGKWCFRNYKRVSFLIFIFVILFFVLYFSELSNVCDKSRLFALVNDKFATCCLIGALSLPIMWQLFIIWIYSSLYRGYMQEIISREAYVYGKAYIAYKLKNIAALPKEYETVARDFVSKKIVTGDDTSLSSLNNILVGRLEKLCVPPNVLQVFWSWIKYNLRGRHNPEAEYIARNGFDYESMTTSVNIEPSCDLVGETLIQDQEMTSVGLPNEINKEDTQV